MSNDRKERQVDAEISVRDAYLAMYYFVDSYLQRGGRKEEDIIILLGAMGPEVDTNNPNAVQTADPAFWDDWLDAVEAAKTRGLPKEL